MIFATVVFILACVAAYLYRDKIKGLVSKVRTDVSKPNVSLPPIDVFPPKPVNDEAQYNAWRASQPVGRQAYIPTWEQKQERDRRVREYEATPARDRSSGNLNDGSVHIIRLTEGEATMTYNFTVEPGMQFVTLKTYSHSNSGFTRKEFTVTGPKSFSGSNLGSEGQNSGPPIIHQNLPAGDYTVVVKYFGVYGGQVATQCHRHPTQERDHPGYTHY